ncbi:unnamed protein product [Rotaria sp. Silwood2]|nr:unnamed protein product [Rotaria sp. Silwood2]
MGGRRQHGSSAELTANLVTDKIRQISTTNTGQTTSFSIPYAATTVSAIKNQTREPVHRLEKRLLHYLHKCTQHVKKLAENRMQLAKAQMEEYKALEDFQQVATPIHWNIHLTLKSKIKTWSTKNKNYRSITKRIELDLPPKFISKIDFRISNIILRKSDKSKVFHLGKLEDYRKKSEEYMDKTQAYKCLGKEDSLLDLIKRTNKYLLDLRLAKWITQKQYELLSIKPNEVELAHLYSLGELLFSCT